MSVRLNYHVPAGTQLTSGGSSHFLYPQKDGSYRAEDVETGSSEVWTLDEFLVRSGWGDATRSNLMVGGSDSRMRIRRGGRYHRDQLSARGRENLCFRKALMAGIEALSAAGVKVTR